MAQNAFRKSADVGLGCKFTSSHSHLDIRYLCLILPDDKPVWLPPRQLLGRGKSKHSQERKSRLQPLRLMGLVEMTTLPETFQAMAYVISASKYFGSRAG